LKRLCIYMILTICILLLNFIQHPNNEKGSHNDTSVILDGVYLSWEHNEE